MSNDPTTSLLKIAKKIEFRDYYLARRIEATLEHAYITWSNPESFPRWFVPRDLTVVSYEHDETRIRIVLRDHLGEEQEYRLRYTRDESNALIELTGGQYFDDQHEGENAAIFTVRFDELSTRFEELDKDTKVAFVQLLIRHPTVEAWYRADGCGLHELWTAAFERYVALAQGRR